MVTYFFCNICGKCPNIPHHYKDSYLKQQQPHLFCLWHSLLINHLLSPKSRWRNMCSCSADWAGSAWQYQTTEILKAVSVQSLEPQAVYLSQAGQKLREASGVPCAAKGSGDGHCLCPPQLRFPDEAFTSLWGTYAISLTLVQTFLSITGVSYQLLYSAFQINNICRK